MSRRVGELRSDRPAGRQQHHRQPCRGWAGRQGYGNYFGRKHCSVRGQWRCCCWCGNNSGRGHTCGRRWSGRSSGSGSRRGRGGRQSRRLECEYGLGRLRGGCGSRCGGWLSCGCSAKDRAQRGGQARLCLCHPAEQGQNDQQNGSIHSFGGVPARRCVEKWLRVKIMRVLVRAVVGRRRMGHVWYANGSHAIHACNSST